MASRARKPNACSKAATTIPRRTSFGSHRKPSIWRKPFDCFEKRQAGETGLHAETGGRIKRLSEWIGEETNWQLFPRCVHRPERQVHLNKKAADLLQKQKVRSLLRWTTIH